MIPIFTFASILKKNLWLIVSIILFPIIIFLWKDNEKRKEIINIHEQKDRVQEKNIKTWIDKEGKSRIQSIAVFGKLNLLEGVMQNEFSEIRKTFGKIKAKNLHSSTNILTVLRDSLNIILTDSLRIVNDSTIKFFAFDFTDSSGYNTYRGEIVKNKMLLKPEIRVPLSAVIHKKKRDKRFFFDWFRRKDYVVEARSDNPSVKIIDIKAIAGKK